MEPRKGPDTRTLLAVFLTVTVYFVWMAFMGPTKPAEVPEEAPVAELPAPAPVPTVVMDPAVVALPEQVLALEGCNSTASLSTVGGGLRAVDLSNFQAPYEMSPLWTWALGGFGAWHPYGESPPGPAQVVSPVGEAFAVGAGALDAPLPHLAVIASDASSATLEGPTGAGVNVRSTWRAVEREGVCTFDLDVTWTNPSAQPWTGDLWIGLHDSLTEAGGGMFSRPMSKLALWAMVDGDVETEATPSELEEARLLPGPVSFMGLADHYFAFAGVELAEGMDGPPASLWFTPRKSAVGEPLTGAQYVVGATLGGGEQLTRRFSVYAGPKTIARLEAVDPRLGDLVQLGFFAFFAKPLLWLLSFFHGLTQNWGLAIVCLTVFLKAVLFPLTQSGMRSAQAMQAVGPLMQEIREQHKDDPETLNRRTMEVFREHKVNPVGGCLPMIVQMPVWIGFFSAIQSSVDLYHVSFLYLKDLSSVDPYAVLPFLVVALMMVQQLITPPAPNMDPAQARMMRVMPLLFGLFFFSLPSGLVLYILVNTTLSIGQQWLIKRSFEAPAAAPAST